MAFGLGVDLIGALAVVVPDFDRRFQYRIRRVTPFARKYHHSMMAFYAKGGQVETTDELLTHLEFIWPILQEDHSDLGEIPFERVAKAYWKRDSLASDGSAYTKLVVEGEHGEELTKIHLGQIGSPIQEYLEDNYRFWGWILLAIGFLIQLVGTLL